MGNSPSNCWTKVFVSFEAQFGFGKLADRAVSTGTSVITHLPGQGLAWLATLNVSRKQGTVCS